MNGTETLQSRATTLCILPVPNGLVRTQPLSANGHRRLRAPHFTTFWSSWPQMINFFYMTVWLWMEQKRSSPEQPLSADCRRGHKRLRVPHFNSFWSFWPEIINFFYMKLWLWMDHKRSRSEQPLSADCRFRTVWYGLNHSLSRWSQAPPSTPF